MTGKFGWILLVLLAFSGVCTAKEPVDNEQVRVLYQAGQDERSALLKLAGKPEQQVVAAQEKIWKNDAKRRDRILVLLREGAIVTAADHWRAAFVLQHGASTKDIQLAYALATIATVLAPEKKQYRWLTAASWDRILVEKGQAQWYGTQFEPDPATGLQKQSRIADGAVSDADRVELGVPTLAESQEMLLQINGGTK